MVTSIPCLSKNQNSSTKAAWVSMDGRNSVGAVTCLTRNFRTHQCTWWVFSFGRNLMQREEENQKCSDTQPVQNFCSWPWFHKLREIWEPSNRDQKFSQRDLIIGWTDASLTSQNGYKSGPSNKYSKETAHVLIKIKHTLYFREMRVLEEVSTHPSVVRVLWLLSCKGRWQIPATCTVIPNYVQCTWKASRSYTITAQVKPSIANEQKICSFSMTV